MSKKSLQYVVNPSHEVISYIRSGYHAFIGCDEQSTFTPFIRALRTALCDSPTEHINAAEATTRRDFAVKIVDACQHLVLRIGGKFRPTLSGIAPSLYEAMRSFGVAGRQGYLIISDIDSVIRIQQTFEFEGPLRGVMQLHDDVAIVMIGSNDLINEMVGGDCSDFCVNVKLHSS